ncbi:MAG: acetate/propionate family kinase [Methylococcaceae bacterium]|nr:acetate/propionate family kinase [Methylococcaceae bacterium]
MKTYLLVINAGSSSIKFAIYQKDGNNSLIADAAGQIENIGLNPHFSVKQNDGRVIADQTLTAAEGSDHSLAFAFMQDWLWAYIGLGQLLAVGHRVVHGGPHFFAPVVVDAAILAALEALIPLAPLHQPHNLAIIRLLQASHPQLPQVACFDTAFHRSQPAVAQAFALPRQFTDAGIYRYGFHGLSYDYIAGLLPTIDASLGAARVIVAHLGNGASLCALHKGQSIATTMSFSPLDGLVMGTRCGSLDASVVLYLQDHYQMDVRAIEDLLYHQSGLLGVSGISGDMRVLLASDHPHAQEAIALFVYRIAREIGSLAAALGGLDALVFTGGIGEHAPAIRALIGAQTAWLGLTLDAGRNAAGVACISSFDSAVSAWVLATDENAVIARHTLQNIPH